MIEAGEPAKDTQIAIVMSTYNSSIVNSLLEGCLHTLNGAGIENRSITIVKVPGAYEIPVVANMLATRQRYNAIIALGAIIRGETPHFDIIAHACSQALGEVAMKYNLPVIFGVLTVNTIQQAKDRSGDEESNKGSEAAKTALDMISVMSKLVNE